MKFLYASFAGLLAVVSADYADPKLLRANGVKMNKYSKKQLETDLILTEQQDYCFLTKRPDASQKWELLEYLSHNCTDADDQFKSAFDKNVRKWDGYMNPTTRKWMIPMMINSDSYPKRYKETAWKNFLWAKEHFAEFTNIDIQFIDEYEAETMFSNGYIKPFYGGSCWSYVGRIAGWKNQPMDIGWCHKIRGSIVHETLHALGFVHEHSRTDRDRYIHVGNPNRDPVNCAAYQMGDLDVSGTGYDFDSIMHYPSGSCGGIRGRGQYRNERFGQREKLSAGDIKGVNNVYPGRVIG